MARVEEELLILGTGLNNLDETAKEIISASKDKRIWLFKGEMGSGKTTLIKAICKKLGVEDLVTSPTFSIVSEYKLNNEPLYHFDFFRIKNLSEAIDLGIEDYFYTNSYCFVEWPDIISKIIPQDYLEVSIESGEGENRTYKLSNYGSY